jgi:hypothetical protein
VPPGCTTCIVKTTSTLSKTTSTTSKSTSTTVTKSATLTSTVATIAPSPSPTCTLFGFPCCSNIVVNPSYDSNNYAYGTENGKSCIVPATCKTCITKNAGVPFPSQSAFQNFITRQGKTLFDGAQVFRFISLNIPNMLNIEKESIQVIKMWSFPEPWEQLDAAATISGFGGRVLRTYTLGFGPGFHVTGLRTYNEVAWKAFDNAIVAARRYNIRLIVPLINHHLGGDANTLFPFGDYGILASWRNKKPSEFFTDALVIADFKHLLSFMLNRVNTVTGIA